MSFRQHRRTRSDAARNRAAIIDATLTTLNESPRATLSEIAAAAGVSRATLYGHFPSRQALVMTALKSVLSQANARLARLDPRLSPDDAVDALVATSWKLLGQFDGMRRLHAEPTDPVRRLLIHGRDDGSFRIDHDLDWQVECVYAIVRAGSSLVTTASSAHADPATDMVTTIRAVLAAVPEGSGTEPLEPHPQQADQP